ncbi:DUF3179 domain-containing (seleno)protein [Dyadobacter sp. CY323]|uniref:DUF3179 domain-containing (seleno)protein n=1 Tax=Dyadobacter sp. CY323 TaxID=2907302 RepID=UPI001F284F5E|nr:DUF3179 domain-containing (seleno)protein [Dyadobacter sp. CY323]MCE6988175.1 DUF3179 domain-containing protein [Dyadobacter sp. CY323]
MKKLFYLGIIGIILYEIAKVYFIMPMPGSQRMNSIDAAYFLHTWRWELRILFWALILVGSFSVFSGKRKWIPAIFLLIAVGLIYATNYEMAADTMFYQPSTVLMKDAAANKVSLDRLVIGTEVNGEAKAYPIQFIGYHHQVRDTLSGQPIMVTYCTVCRTGRVFEPSVKRRPALFRLVGMDHFNAMFEDEETGSWWRQSNGEAIAGPLKGEILPELSSVQTSLREWIKLHPNSKIMQPDPVYQAKYDSMSRYESGRGKSELTRTDTTSWKDKSWIVGIQVKGASKAFDWNRLKKEKIINERVGTIPVVLVLASDEKSFFAFERSGDSQKFDIKNDTLLMGESAYTLSGKAMADGTSDLKRINAYQEFWHSWQTFHPDTQKY